MSLPTFEVDKEGLRKILARRGIAFAALELIQNALDERVTRVDVALAPVAGHRARYMLTVVDDNPDGFADLSHAWTLFAESKKKANAEQRGRFNLGEKLVIAACEEAVIETTTGCVEFSGRSRRHPRRRRASGSEFCGTLRLTDGQACEIAHAVASVLVPHGVTLTLNGAPVPYRGPVAMVEAALATEVADAEGYLRPTTRKTSLWIYEPRPGEAPTLYEMGIPVVETGDRWHVNVFQKVPLNVDRDNVTPAYLRHVRTLVVNAMANRMSGDEAAKPWVATALEDPRVADEAVHRVLTTRYGERRVIADPSDPEGTKLAVAQGYAVIQAGSFSGDAWANIKRAGAARPAGQVTPSPKPFSPDGSPLKLAEAWTPAMHDMASRIAWLGDRLVGRTVRVRFALDAGWGFTACYGHGELTVNLCRVGKAWCGKPLGNLDVMRLLLHEFAHELVSDHLSHKFHEEVARLGALAVQVAADEPARFIAARVPQEA